jgi:serine/threonine-protein kinase
VKRRGTGRLGGEREAASSAREEERAKAIRRARVWVVGLGLLVVGTFGAYLLGRLAAHSLLLPAAFSRPGVGEAPDLVGKDLDEARREMDGVVGGLDVLGVSYATEVDSGKVLFQYPPEGLPLEPGKPVEVLLSAGPGRRRMPDVTGLPEKAGVALLERAGVKALRIATVSEPGTERGAIVSTQPEAGAAWTGADSVVVNVSRGGDVIEVPNLAGKTPEEAGLILEGAQLSVGKTTFAEDEDSPGGLVVVGQDPPAGGLATSGSAVDLRLGRSPDGGED